MKEQKKIRRITFVLILTLLFVFAAIGIIRNWKILQGTPEVEDFIPSELAKLGFVKGKITLADTYATVIELLGKPKNVADEQSMYPINNVILKNCQYLMYDNFFVILGEGKVIGWYYNPEKVREAISDLFYLPGLETQAEGTFLDFYQNWEKLSNQSYTKTFANFNKYNLGKVYFCTYYLEEGAKTKQLAIHAYNSKYKIKQIYFFEADKMVTKVLEAKELPLLKTAETYAPMFLGRDAAYIKKYFAQETLKRDKEIVDAAGNKVHFISFVNKGEVKANVFEFDIKKDNCYLTSVSYLN